MIGDAVRMCAARTSLTFAAALIINTIATVAWYWWRPFPAGLASYLPHLTTVVGGFLVGFFARRGTVKKLALLSVLIAINDGLIHGLAVQAGMTQDMSTVTAIAFMSMLQTIYNLAIVFLGGALGWACRGIVNLTR